MSRTYLAAGLVALALCSSTLAQGVQDLPDRPIKRAEVLDVVKRQFAAMDTNHDGSVSRAEFEHYRAVQQQASGRDASLAAFDHIGAHWFERADADGDGRVTLAEAEDRPMRLFNLADTDHDGVVSVEEKTLAAMLMSFGGH